VRNELKKSGFPISMLEENVLCPIRTLPGERNEWPVFLVQATFIRQGLVLTCQAHHQVMDLTGQAQVMMLHSKACRKVPFTHGELSIGNMSRRNITPMLDEVKRAGTRSSDETVT